MEQRPWRALRAFVVGRPAGREGQCETRGLWMEQRPWHIRGMKQAARAAAPVAWWLRRSHDRCGRLMLRPEG